MEFRYRYVGFRTSFRAVPGLRQDAGRDADALFANELALDVGNACWGYDSEERSVIDHHFHRGNQFPCAAAAVLHKAEAIWQRFHDAGAMGGAVWMVTHRDPDFDALCAMYLARAVLGGDVPHAGWRALGLHSDGWSTRVARGEAAWDWFRPNLQAVAADPARRWPVLFAAYAAAVDNCRRLGCSRQRAFHSVLYAAMTRGREFRADGGRLLFDAARAAVTAGLNPLFDSLWDGSQEFAPELAMLDREVEAYARDVARARRAIVSVPQSAMPFDAWFGSPAGDSPDGVCAEPLLTDDLAIRAAHLVTDQNRSQIDGIFLRDPECILFKEWAREDRDHSSTGNGFLFTAVAYSSGNKHAEHNDSRYVFALDPERAEGRHLYPIWAALQAAEVRALKQAAVGTSRPDAPAKARHGYDARGGQFAGLFDDPWFDGSNYQCTIIDTPNRGTAIAQAGYCADLTDDPVAATVRELLEFSVFTSPLCIRDLPATTALAGELVHVMPLTATTVVTPVEHGRYRFGTVVLSADVQLVRPSTADQTGRLLWQVLDADSRGSVPADFAERHLIQDSGWVGVWSRRGAVIAHNPLAEASARELVEQFRRMAELTRGVQALVERFEPGDVSPDAAVQDTERFLADVARLKHALALPENRLAARFFDALRLDEVLATVRGLSLAAEHRVVEQHAKRQRDEVQELTRAVVRNTAGMERNIAVVAKVQMVLEYLEVFFVSVYAAHLWHMFAHDNEQFAHLLEAGAARLGLTLSSDALHWLVSLGVLFWALVGGVAAALFVRPKWPGPAGAHGEKLASAPRDS